MPVARSPQNSHHHRRSVDTRSEVIELIERSISATMPEIIAELDLGLIADETFAYYSDLEQYVLIVDRAGFWVAVQNVFMATSHHHDAA